MDPMLLAELGAQMPFFKSMYSARVEALNPCNSNVIFVPTKLLGITSCISLPARRDSRRGTTPASGRVRVSVGDSIVGCLLSR